MSNENILWIVFAILLPVVLVLDLGVFQRKAHEINAKEALISSGAYILLALIFAVVIYFMLGSSKALTFLTGYIVEISLSIDNLFVFMLLLSSFAVPKNYQHRVLFWGIIGAILARGIFIATGLVIVNALSWVIYIFGAFLVYTGIKIAIKKDEEADPQKNFLVKLATKYLPMTNGYRGGKFFTRENARLLATPLLLVLVVIDLADVVFATDSIPAIISITTDSFLIYTSNIFAIMGLRSMYFGLVHLTKRLVYLNYGLAAILILLGMKMLVSEWYQIPVAISLGAIVGILALAALASFLWPPKKTLDENTLEEK
jgi:tellurite resistance protein TerC